MRSSLPGAIALVAALSAPATGLCQGGADPTGAEPRAEPPAPFGPHAMVWPGRLCLKVRDAARPACTGGVLVSRSGADLQGLPRALAAAAVEPLVPDVPLQVLDAWHARAAAALPPGRRPGHMGSWLRVRCASAAAAAALREQLLRHPLVEHCYPEPRFAGAAAGCGDDPPPPTPSFTAMQGNLDDAPHGTGLRWAHGILGARGQGVRLRMVEKDFFTDHEDVTKLVAGSFLGVPPPGTTESADHGTSGAALVVADRNRFGMTGAADLLDARFVGSVTNGTLANSLLLAAADCGQGDVILLVVMFLLGQLGPDDWVPAEFLRAEFDAVLTATSNGRIVVSTAANGSRSLDDPRFLRRFDRSYRDSGAILVGATDGAALVRAAFCNYGSCVDANSWGANVVTVGYGTLFFGNNDRRQAYTAQYMGTSASTPVIAGAVAALQGAARRQLGRSLAGAEIRALLRTHGTPVPGSIGPRTDMRALFQATGIFDGLELSAPDVLPGGAVQVEVSGGGGGALLLGSFGTGDVDLGLNRRLHLDPAQAVTLDFRPLAGGRATFPIGVPASAVLHGLELYLQAAVLPPAGPVHVTNSGHLSVL